MFKLITMALAILFFPSIGNAALSKIQRAELYQQVEQFCRFADDNSSVITYEGSLEAGADFKVFGIEGEGTITKLEADNLTQLFEEFRTNRTICRFEMINTLMPLFSKNDSGIEGDSNGSSNKYTSIDWRTKGSIVDGKHGQTFHYKCPENGTVSRKVYGSGIYSVKSTICSSAVHDGRITAAAGGYVSIQALPRPDKFIAVERNGVKGNKWGSQGGAFKFVEN